MATNTPASKPADSTSGSTASSDSTKASGTASTSGSKTDTSGAGSSAPSAADEVKIDQANRGDGTDQGSDGKPSQELLERVAKRAPHVDSKFVSEYGMSNQDLEDIATGLQPAPPRVGPIHNVDLHRTPGGWQITPVGVKPEDLPETGRVPADVLSPGLTQGDDLSGTLSQGNDLQ